MQAAVVTDFSSRSSCVRCRSAESRKLADVNEAFEEVLGNRVPARLVIEF